MALDPRKRQRKLEKRRAKQKAERREVARLQSQGLAGQFQQAAAAPVLHCLAATDLWEQGIGNVLISRRLKDGAVAFVVFLVDMYCLGVKDVIMNVAPRARYDRDLYGKLADQATLVPLKPECARKLVEGAVEYARDLGLPPYPDYRTAKLIFGDVVAEACSEQYVYGKNGKPFFVAGPYDGPLKCRQILRTLENHVGPDGYHFLMPVGGPHFDIGMLPDEEEPSDENLLPP